MRKSIYLTWIFLCIAINTLNAQESNKEGDSQYLPVLEVGKSWTYKTLYAHDDPCTENPYPYFTLTVYKVINEDGRDIFLLRPNYVEENNFNDADAGRGYEESGVVWHYSYEEDEYLPMVDFNVNVGDIISDEAEVISKEYVEIQGITRCLITIKPFWTKAHYYWCEGIGAISDWFISPVIKHLGESVVMTECWLDNNCLYNEDSLDKYLNRVEILNKENEDSTIYDINGNRVDTPEKGNLYIQSSKKIIW